MRWLPPLVLSLAAAAQAPTGSGLVYTGDQGPLHGSHVVFVAGDEEYRSEQSLPQLARILAFRLGARCSVVLPIDPRSGAIDPGVTNNLPGLDALRTADLLVLLTRFRALDDADMQQFADFVDAGKPIVALRTSTHAFALPKTSKFAAWSWNAPDGGFGRRVLGETWIAHHGQHGVQGTRGRVAPGADQHVILRGIDAAKVFDPADVYRVRLPLPDGCVPLLLGEVLQSMAPDALPVPDQGERMPILWTRELPVGDGERRQRVVTTTLGSAAAFAHESTRRLCVNACLWALGRDAAIRSDLDVALVGDYEPRAFGFGKHASGERPADLVWPRTPRPNPEK
ncbi:MAG: ThuA domain-containing protein [Planctomycetes bacterium]|nr:ThuA domain-containing protein [Planctomycetota bacterium]MCC7395675.1 ThuA domain-containing protein [Planctomycetota bacterium]